MPLSRRALLQLVAAAGAGAAAVPLREPLRAIARWFGPPALEDAAPGPLHEAQVQTLLAAATAAVGEPLREEHYAGFFRWRAEHLRGHRALYDRFCHTVNRAARRAESRSFAGCTIATRRSVVARAFRARADTHVRGRWLRRALDHDWVLYDRHILQEALALFAATDAWLLLGYEAWPGVPRGFERYRQAPAGHGG